jgi:2-dehydro-3-deoxygalactonokinase
MTDSSTGTDRIAPDWIAVDWGSSRLRAWAMRGAEAVAEAASDAGIGSPGAGGFAPALIALIAPWLQAGRRIPVLACGMVGSREGWVEAPYRRVPCVPVDRGALTFVSGTDARIALAIVPGLMQASPPDVMRGEEVQVAGALALVPGFDGVICLPGTHTKWVHVSAGEVVSFQTAMTGELFALLSRQSVLRHGMAGDGWDAAAFDAAVSEAMSRPERLAARLFALRAEDLLAGLPAGSARARLSGLLIGAELAAARPYWLGQPVIVAGDAALAGHYARALAAQGLRARVLPGAGVTLAGLVALRAPGD